MLDPKIFRMEKLLSALMREDASAASPTNWRWEAEIIEIDSEIVGKSHAQEFQVRLGKSYLRHSRGPRQGHFWDIYGDDYQSPELALVALLQAEPPMWLVKTVEEQVSAELKEIEVVVTEDCR